MSVHDLQAPKENGALLAYPPLADVGHLLDDNRRRLAASRLDVLGSSFQTLRSLARREIIDAAKTYLTAAGETFAAPQGDAIILAGHQPELFHPGVWLKNFALNGLARRHNAVPINLVVDNDTAKNTLLTVPAGAHVAQLPFDHWQSEVPFEERHILDEELFRNLPSAAAPITSAWHFTPLLNQFWDEVCRQGQRTPLLGERFAAARRVFERRWSCTNLEVPLSLVCQTEVFAWFACHLCENLAAFQDAYNGEVQAYRRRYHMRSRHHPVPDLARDGDWLEAPLWAWHSGSKRRERLFVRRSSLGLELRAGAEPWPTLRLSSRPEEIVTQWRSLEGAGYKVRTRALTTTMFARLFLGDLFLHGLGGGKYDELTDDIMRRFYNIEPPAFLVVTGTLLLPLPHLNVSRADRNRLHALQRDLWWNPQRHVDGDAQAHALRAAKIAWIKRHGASSPQNRERYETLRKLTSELRPFVRHDEAQTRLNLEQTERTLQVALLRERRDYAFCLYPEELLRDFCTPVL